MKTHSDRRLPGAWLLAIAGVVFDESVLTTVVHQTIADLRTEWLDAGTNPGCRFRARWRGYVAFWSLLVAAPFAFRRWPARRTNRRAFWQVTAFAAMVLIVVAAWRTTVTEFLAPILNNLPEGTMAQLGRAGTFVFLAGPAALLAALAIGWTRSRDRFTTRVPSMTMLSLLSVPATALISTAGIIGTFEEIGRSGGAGLGSVSQGMLAATAPAFYAVVAVIAGLLLCAAVAARSRPFAAVETNTRPAFWKAAGLSLLLIVSVVAVDQVLRQQHELLNRCLALFQPPTRTSGGMATAQSLEEGVAFVLFGSAGLTIVLLTAGLATWRGAATAAFHPLLTWTSRAVLVMAIAGTSWHASVIRSDVNAIRKILASQAAQAFNGGERRGPS